MNSLLVSLVLLLGPLFSCAEDGRTFQKVPVIITGTESGQSAGVSVLSSGQVVPSNINLEAKAKGETLETTLYNLASGTSYEMALYTPYAAGFDRVRSGHVTMKIPSRQNASTMPIRYGKVPFSIKNGKAVTLNCPLLPTTSELVIDLSTSNPAYEGYEVEHITVYAEGGDYLSGDMVLDLQTGKVIPDDAGQVSSAVSYVPDTPLTLSSSIQKVRIVTCPASLYHKPVRVEYALKRDGKSLTLCHRFNSFSTSLKEGLSVVLNERILEISHDWYLSEYPGLEWEKVAPESLGYSSQKLDDLTSYIDKNLSTTSMMVVVDGKVIYEYAKPGRTMSDTVRIASCRKSLLSMMYGKYVENGTVDLEATLEDLGIDEDPATIDGVLLPIERKAKVRHLITARSGVYHMPSNDGDDHAYAPPRGSQEPGTYYLYNNWDFNCAGAILEMLVGKNIYEIFRDDIAIQIGLQDYYVDGQRKSGNASYSKFPAYHFWLSTRDMARIALLMLHKGSWNGRQVVSEAWVERTTSVVTPRAEMHPDSRLTKEFDYGYLWWLFCKEFSGYDPNVYEGGYTATGLGGQYFTVLPKLNMVIAHKDETGQMGKSTYYKLIGRVAACRK